MEENRITDKFVDFLFSKSNLKYLILLFIVGFILRSIIAVNIAPNADEMLHAPHAINFINSGKLQIMDQDPIWFFLTDLSYKIFGVNMFAARFLAILFGSLSIFVLYLIVSKLYNKNLALISSIILTFSSFHILMSLAEMDIAMMFFILISLYLFITALKDHKEKYFIVSYLFLGVAILVKQIAITFIPAFIIFFIYYKLKNKEKIKFKQIIIFILIMFLISFPVLTFNYLLYKDKGLVDLQFSRFFGIAEETYAPIEATLKPFRLNDVFFSYDGHSPGIIEGLAFFYSFDKLILILGVLGFIIALFTKKEFLLLFGLSFLFPFIFLAGTSLLEYHFIFGVPILSLFAAIFIYFLAEKLSKTKIKKNVVIGLFLSIIIIFNIFVIMNRGGFSGKSEITKVMSYSKENIEDNALVIVDTRIYRGRIAFAFNDKHYLEASRFNEAIEILKQSPQQEISIKTYFIECITDDCGWGTIAQQPELNKSMEEITDFFKNSSQTPLTLTNRFDEPYFNIYQTNLLIKEDILDLADATHEWFYYPLRYEPKERIFDNYNTKNIFDKFIDWIAHLILYIEVLIALLSIIVIFYILIRNERELE